MQSFSPYEVSNRYGVSSITVRNWIKRGAIGANVRTIGKQKRSKITVQHIEEFERRTGAVAIRPEIASTREDIVLGRNSGGSVSKAGLYKRHNSASARNSAPFVPHSI